METQTFFSKIANGKAPLYTGADGKKHEVLIKNNRSRVTDPEDIKHCQTLFEQGKVYCSEQEYLEDVSPETAKLDLEDGNKKIPMQEVKRIVREYVANGGVIDYTLQPPDPNEKYNLGAMTGASNKELTKEKAKIAKEKAGE